MLVAAFAGREPVLAAYAEATRQPGTVFSATAMRCSSIEGGRRNPLLCEMLANHREEKYFTKQFTGPDISPYFN